MHSKVLLNLNLHPEECLRHYTKSLCQINEYARSLLNVKAVCLTSELNKHRENAKVIITDSANNILYKAVSALKHTGCLELPRLS